MKESFCIKLENKGITAYLSINGKTNWKDLRTAKKHARDMVCSGCYERVTIETNETGTFVLELA